MRNNWTSLAFDSWALTLEASTVIGLRLAKLARMDAAAMDEAQLMVAEKVEAVSQLQLRALTGALGGSHDKAARATIAHYRKAVRKNRRRLSGARAR